MRSLLIGFAMLAACDLQPAKQDRAAGSLGAQKPTTPAPAPAPAAGPAAPAPGAGAGSGKQLMETTAECTSAAVHIANVVIESLEDPSIKAAQEQDRTRLVRRIAETCTRDKWPAAAQQCFLKGKTAPELEACGRDLAAPSAP